jgi:hypothetical protein
MSMYTEDFPTEVLDQEWQLLLLTAREMGLTLEEIRDFLQQAAPGPR